MHVFRPSNPTQPPTSNIPQTSLYLPTNSSNARKPLQKPLFASEFSSQPIPRATFALPPTARPEAPAPAPAAMSSSADTTPISPARFANALKSLSVEMLHLKVLEIRNSIAHLQYSNDQLKPFAEGTSSSDAQADPDCVEAITENEAVIDRMAERIALVRMEVEERGVSWTEFQSKDEVEALKALEGTTNGEAATTNGNGGPQSDPWTDGTFQTGTIRNGEITMDEQPRRPQAAQGGTLNDEQLRRAMEERMRNLGTDDDDNDANGGMHL